MEGCGTYVTDEDSYSPAIDLHFSSGDDCTALGRYIRVSEGQVQMYLNISACGELGRVSLLLPHAFQYPYNCICEEDVAGELLIEDKVSIGVRSFVGYHRVSRDKRGDSVSASVSSEPVFLTDTFTRAYIFHETVPSRVPFPAELKIQAMVSCSLVEENRMRLLFSG